MMQSDAGQFAFHMADNYVKWLHVWVAVDVYNERLFDTSKHVWVAVDVYNERLFDTSKRTIFPKVKSFIHQIILYLIPLLLTRK